MIKANKCGLSLNKTFGGQTGLNSITSNTLEAVSMSELKDRSMSLQKSALKGNSILSNQSAKLLHLAQSAEKKPITPLNRKTQAIEFSTD